MAVSASAGGLDLDDVAWCGVQRGVAGEFGGLFISQEEVSAGLAGFELRGIALDPTTGHLHVLSPERQRLYEVTKAGLVVANRDPGLPNWINTTGHRQGMMLFRWTRPAPGTELPDVRVEKVVLDNLAPH